MAIDVAFVGAGWMNGVHMENVAAIDGARVAAVCDVDEERAGEAAQEYGCAAYTDHRALFENEYDAAYVAVPPFAREGQERLAVQTGADLFVEKPLALDRETARKNLEAIEEHDAIAAVGYVLRYAELVDRVRELVGDRTVSLIDGRYWVPAPETGWWREKSRSGGQVVEQSTHVFDLLRYLAGDVHRVCAAGDRRVVESIDFEDTTSATLHHSNGTVSHVSSTSAAPGTRCQVGLVGDGFELDVGFFEGRLSGTVDGEDVEREVVYESEADRYREETERFLEAVRTGDPSPLRSTYDDAIESFELTLAVQEAIETGETRRMG